MKEQSLIEMITNAHQMHQKARRRWLEKGNLSEEDYRRDVGILMQCVREGQEIETIRTKVILKHHEEIQKYDELKEAFETGNVPNAIKDYMKVFDNFDELYRLMDIEDQKIYAMMRDASYIND